MKINLQTILIMALMVAMQSAYAQYTGGDGRGDVKDASNQTPLSGFDAMFFGGSGRGDFALTATGLSCINPNSGGTISEAQNICSGGTPSAFTSTTLTGETGTLEYKWQKSTTNESSDFADVVPAALTAGYNPGPLTTNTWYKRLVKVSCSEIWLESNVVKITIDEVNPVVVAKTGATVTLDPDGNYTLLADDLLSSYTDAGVGIQSVTMLPPTVNCTDIGLNTINVTVKDDCNNQTVVTAQITVKEEGTVLLIPWLKANTVTAANGTSTYSPCTANGTFRLTATGQSTTSNDVMHFVYQPLSGNGTVIARLNDIQNGGWAGVMMRENNDPGAKTILFKTRLYNPNVFIGYRKTTNKTMVNLSQVAQLIHWMKIQRNGDVFQVFTSYNGTTWLRRYTGTIAMSTCNAGIFTESIAANRTSVATFDNAEVVGYLKSGEVFAEAEIINLDGEQAGVSIYPNPAKDEVNIVMKGFQTYHGIGTLLTTDGKTVKSFTICESQTQLNVQDLKPGVYILRFENAENVVIKKLVIQ